MANPSTTLSVTVAQAVAYLTRPLIVSYSATTIIRLQLILEANLIALFESTWWPNDPLRGSGRRCLTLSPDCLPPRAIYSACVATGVQWFDWIALLGGREFDFFVDPGCISLRFGQKTAGGKLHTIWSDEVQFTSAPPAPAASEAMIQARFKAQVEARTKTKTFAQQLIEDDEAEGETIFAMIADKITEPTWTPILDQFPMVPPRSISPLSTMSSHSRSSSCSSTSGFSFSSSDSFSSISSASSSSASQVADPSKKAMSRKERSRQARVFVDTTKVDVTPYDGGKTTVLTGGVMLGAKLPRQTKPLNAPSATSWRSHRA
jgi:hypothetical protein